MIYKSNTEGFLIDNLENFNNFVLFLFIKFKDKKDKLKLRFSIQLINLFFFEVSYYFRRF